MPDSATINVLAEMERMGYAFDWAGDSELKCICPFHNASSASCHVNVEKRLFRCFSASCGKTGDFITFMARVLKTTRAVVVADLSTRYTMEVAKVISVDVVERAHQRLPAAGPLMKSLADRAVTMVDIRKYRLGEDGGRITIPISNASGDFVNIRKYLPGAPGRTKMRNTKGHGQIRLYPIEQLNFDTVLLCGGEIKAIVAAAHLNRHGIGAITATAGEGNWDASFTPLFTGKTVYVCMDVDVGGVKAAQEHCKRLSRVVGWIGLVELPLDLDKYPNGDINDYVASGKSLKRLLKGVEEWCLPSQVTLEDAEPIDYDLIAATHARTAGKRLRVSAVVSTMDTAPYIIPKELKVVCEQDQKECSVCAAFGPDGTFTLHVESSAILEMVAATKACQREALMSGLGIPAYCKVCDFEIISYYNVEDTRVSPRLEITSRSTDRVMQPAVCIGPGVELNESYSFVGRMYPHPKTQLATLLISSYEPTEDALSTYECKDLDALLAFRPDNWTVEAIAEKLASIYEDLEANVTRIYQRRDLHLAVDLAYHSPLLLQFDGRTVKGWAEVLILGDSAQGKTETAINLQKHYGLGEKVECKNASVAGLLGGLQQLGSRWFVSWGVIPTHDKRLVILEELKGASPEVISKLTDMRSSGVAEIPKIEKRRTHARTRLIALSNPRGNLQLRAYNFGVEAIKELVGGLEDVRRFDFTLLVSSSDIDPSNLNRLQRERPQVAPRYEGGICRSLILWTWTRDAEQVVFEDVATQLVLKEATALSNEFTDMIPLIDRGSTRYKLARLAASLAARTFSTGETSDTLLVRVCHVEYIVAMIRRIYNSDVFGYRDYTEAIRITQVLLDPEAIKTKLGQTPFPKDFCKQLLHTQKLDLQDLQDGCAWDRQEALQLLSFFVRKHALQRDGRGYRKTPSFITLLKELIDGNELTDRPSFIPEEF